MLLKSKNIAYLGVLLALNQIFIIISSVLETNTIFLFALAALMIGIVIIEFGVRSGIVFYIASCLLGYFLTLNKIEIFTYILFFGLYSIVKYYLENLSFGKRLTVVVEFTLKLIFFNLAAICLYIFLKEFAVIKLYWWLTAAAQIVFILYDYAFSVLINLYLRRIRPKLKI